MGYRLLLDIEVASFVTGLSKRVRVRLFEHLNAIRTSPDTVSDFHEYDATGRRIEVSIFAGYSLHYWVDFPDRHIKVLAMTPADRG